MFVGKLHVDCELTAGGSDIYVLKSKMRAAGPEGTSSSSASTAE